MHDGVRAHAACSYLLPHAKALSPEDLLSHCSNISASTFISSSSFPRIDLYSHRPPCYIILSTPLLFSSHASTTTFYRRFPDYFVSYPSRFVTPNILCRIRATFNLFYCAFFTANLSAPVQQCWSYHCPLPPRSLSSFCSHKAIRTVSTIPAIPLVVHCTTWGFSIKFPSSTNVDPTCLKVLTSIIVSLYLRYSVFFQLFFSFRSPIALLPSSSFLFTSHLLVPSANITQRGSGLVFDATVHDQLTLLTLMAFSLSLRGRHCPSSPLIPV